MEACAKLVARFADGRDAAAVACCSRALGAELGAEEARSVWAELAEEHFGLRAAGTTWRRVARLPCEGQAYTATPRDPKEAYLVMRASMAWAGVSFAEFRTWVLPAGLAWHKLLESGLTAAETGLKLHKGCGKLTDELRRFGEAGLDAYGVWAFHDGQSPDGRPLFGYGGAYQYLEQIKFCGKPAPHMDVLILAARHVPGTSPVAMIPATSPGGGWMWSDRRERPSGVGAVEMLAGFAEAVASRQVGRDAAGVVQRFPLGGADTVTTEAHGIRVQVSVIEMVSGELPRWAYQFRIESSDALPHKSVQLVGRRWEIAVGEEGVETVEGPGVVGQYPILLKGGGWVDPSSMKQHEGAFTYSSFVGPQYSRAMLSGTFGGHLKFTEDVTVPVGPVPLRSRAAYRLDSA